MKTQMKRYAVLASLASGSLAALAFAVLNLPADARAEELTVAAASGAQDFVSVNAGSATCGAVPLSPPAGLCRGKVRLSDAIPSGLRKDPATVGLNYGKEMVDCFAWKTFSALSYPSSNQCRGEPAGSTPPKNWTNDRVWETYKEPFELFQATKPNWNPKNVDFNDDAPTGSCGDTGSGKKLLRRATKFPLVDEDYQAFLSSVVLTDQQGNTVWYEVLFNRDVFEYIRDEGLAKTGAYSFGGPVDDSVSVDFPLPEERKSKAGTIEVKAAWRIMTSDDNLNRYFTQEAVVYDGTDCVEETVGLVGLHITRKVESSPKWIWATFEHVDNVPKAGTDGDGREYNFFSKYCAINQPSDCDTKVAVTDTDHICCPNLIPYPIPDPAYSTNQVTRLDPISGSKRMEKRFRKAFKKAGSPFYYFKLVGAQWAKPRNFRGRDTEQAMDQLADLLDRPSHGSGLMSAAHEYFGENPAWQRPCNPNGPWGIDKPGESEACYQQIPKALRNTSMETLIVQTNKKGTQYSADSCMNCHFAGGVDGSYLWLDAMLNPYKASSN